MSSLIARIDRFVRWFFNVSPHVHAIEPRPLTPRQEERRRRRALAVEGLDEARLQARERRYHSVRTFGRNA